MSLPPLVFLRECFRYDAGTGQLFWRTRPRSHFASGRAHTTFNSKYAGLEAGTRRPECVVVNLSGRRYKAHRLIWLLHYGVEPPEQIDHHDGNPHNNRAGNLRLASNQQNQFNRKAPKHNTSGFKGVCWDKPRGRWRAQMSIDRKSVFFGHYDTPEEAAAAYAKGAEKYAKEFARS